MAQRVVRLAQIASTKHNPGLVPASPATVWRLAKAGKFPKPFKLSPGITVWDADEIDQWIAQQRGARK
jgi:predicted DNA-binding transcriptional regulator AlpA